MLRETSVCMFTVPISSSAATSVDSGTTDDTGIGSSCPLPSPSLPNGHSDPEFGNDNPPPIPPKASRRIPPIPPRNGFHNVDNTDTGPLPIHRNRLPISFNPSEDNIFSADLFYPMSCPCGRVEPSVSEVNRISVFHPTQCEVKASSGPKFGCGSLQRIRTTLSRLFRSVSLREPFRKGTAAVSDTVRTPTLPPRSLSRNLERTSLHGLSSTQTLHAIYSTDQSPCVSSLRRRQPNQKFAPPPPVSPTSGTAVTGRNPPPSHCSSPPLASSLRRQRTPLAAATCKSSSASHLRGRRQQQRQLDDSCDSSASTYASASRDTSSFARVGGPQPTAGQKSNNNSVATANDLVQQASAVAASSPSRQSGGGASPRRLGCFSPGTADSPTLTSSTQPAQQPPPPVLLHHVHHIHHFHHFHHHHHRESGEVCPAPGLTPPPPLSEAGQSNSSGGSSPAVGCGDHLLGSNAGRCSAAALAPPVSVVHPRSSNCCACCCCASASCCACSSSYPCSPDPLNNRGSPMAITTTTGLDNQLRHPPTAVAATADTLTRQTSTPFDSSNPNCCCQSRQQDTSNLQPPLRCCSSASATLPSPRGSPASGCLCCGCGCGCGCLGSRSGSPPLHQQHHQQRPHHVHHHRRQHHSHQHRQQAHVHHHLHSLHPPTATGRHECRSRTAGSGVYCCCGASLPRALGGSVDSSWRLSTGLTPPRCLAAATPCSSGAPLRAGLSAVSPRAAAPSRDSPRHSSAAGGHQPRASVMPPLPSAVVPTALLSSTSVFSPVVNSTLTTNTTSTTCPSTLTAELQDGRSSFQRSMLELRKMGWYWGPLSFDQAQLLLAKRPDGTFLVRDSGHETYILSLSFRVRGETYHTRIEHSQGRFSFWSQPQSHSASTMVEFIEKAVAHSISGQFHYFLQSHAPGQPPVEVPLLYPLSRFQVVASLRHLVRFTILSHIRRDHIDQLPLPQGMLHYLSEKQCYVESLSAFEEAIRDRPPLPFQPRQAAIAAVPAPGGSGPDQAAEGPTLARPETTTTGPPPPCT